MSQRTVITIALVILAIIAIAALSPSFYRNTQDGGDPAAHSLQDE